MINLDYSKLQPLSSNKPENKNSRASDNQTCKDELEKYLTNFKEYMLSKSVYDMTSLLIAEQDWIRRYKNTKTFPDSLVGRILKVDFGKTYLCENGFIHFAICISEFQGKYCVIPMTTSNDEIKIAYHPKYRPTGEKRLYLLKKADGNSKDAALYINDMKYISSGRIIDVHNKISESAYISIIELLCEISNPQFYNKIDRLNDENQHLHSELINIQEKYEMLETKCKLLEEKNHLLEQMSKMHKK